MLAMGSSTRNAYKMPTTNEFGYGLRAIIFRKGKLITNFFDYGNS